MKVVIIMMNNIILACGVMRRACFVLGVGGSTMASCEDDGDNDNDDDDDAYD